MVSIIEFALNLDHLANKKVQFFPFGKNDKVLKVAAGEQQKPSVPKSHLASRNNTQFIQEKEEFLKRIGSGTSSSRFRGETSSVKSFSDQTKGLLAEIKSIKQQKNTERLPREQDFNDYYQQGYDSGRQSALNRVITKSNSVSHMGVRAVRNPRRQENDDSSNKSSLSQRHKLVLKNLEIVTCDNEYY